MKRRNIRCGVLFVVMFLLLLCISVDTLVAFLLACAASVVFRFAL